jgi:hypothetical protein
MTSRVVSTEYLITSAGVDGDDENLLIKVSIDKGPNALSGMTEEGVITFVRNFLQTKTTNPINIQKTQTIQTDGL